MELQLPMILILLAANALWLLVGYAIGFKEGKREGLVIGKSIRRASENAR